MGLNVLETFCEGDFVLAKRLKFVRKYLVDTRESTMFSYHTQVFDTTLAESDFRGQVGIFHGFAQCQDTFVETALHYALNGFIVHLIDFEGYGFTAGRRCSGLRIENMHSQVTSLLTQVREDLPLFLMGHSMGCMVLNTYLQLNPEIASRLAGVIYSAPFFGLPPFVKLDPVKI